jgi:S-adenosyl-L-methionine hydrolase (adenosine-forming)
VEVEVGDRRRRATYAHTFADVPVGELLVYEDAARTLAIAVNRGDAAAMLEIRLDAEVRLRPG